MYFHHILFPLSTLPRYSVSPTYPTSCSFSFKKKKTKNKKPETKNQETD